MANIYNDPSSINVKITALNNTYEYLTTHIGNVKFGFTTDLHKWVYSDVAGNIYKCLTDASGATNTPSGCIFLADDNGSANHDTTLVYQNDRLGVNIGTPQNKLHLHEPTTSEVMISITNGSTGSADSNDGLTVGIDGHGNNVIRSNYGFPLHIQSEEPFSPGTFSTIASFDPDTILLDANTSIGGTLNVSSIPARSTAATLFLTHTNGEIQSRTAQQLRGDIGAQAAVTGAATTITSSNLTANRALISDGSGKVAVSAVTSTELGYLDGVTSAIQTQLNAKQPIIAGTANRVLKIQPDGSGVAESIITDDGSNAIFSGNIIGSGSIGVLIRPNTSDGSDAKLSALSGGGGTGIGRGADVVVYGNENTSYPGKLFLGAGVGNGTTAGFIELSGDSVVVKKWYYKNDFIRHYDSGYATHKYYVLLCKKNTTDQLSGQIIGLRNAGMTRYFRVDIHFVSSTYNGGQVLGQIGRSLSSCEGNTVEGWAEVTYNSEVWAAMVIPANNIAAHSMSWSFNGYKNISDSANWMKVVRDDDSLLTVGTTYPRRVIDDNIVCSISDISLLKNVNVSGNIIGSRSSLFLGTNSVDGADNKYAVLAAASTSGITRGGYVAVYGNEESNNPGSIRLVAGNGNGTTSGAVEVTPRMFLGTRPTKDDFWHLALGPINTLYNDNNFNILRNAYYSSGSWKYRDASPASALRLNAGGGASLLTAPTGTVDGNLNWNTAIHSNELGNTAFGKNSVTDGFRVDIDGNLRVNGKLTITSDIESSGVINFTCGGVTPLQVSADGVSVIGDLSVWDDVSATNISASQNINAATFGNNWTTYTPSVYGTNPDGLISQGWYKREGKKVTVKFRVAADGGLNPKISLPSLGTIYNPYGGNSDYWYFGQGWGWTNKSTGGTHVEEYIHCCLRVGGDNPFGSAIPYIQIGVASWETIDASDLGHPMVGEITYYLN